MGASATLASNATNSKGYSPFVEIQGNISNLEDQVNDFIGRADNVDQLILNIQTAIDMLIISSADLQEEVGDNTELIEALENELASIEAALATKQNILNGVCPAGQFLVQINPDGSIVCQVAGGSGASPMKTIVTATSSTTKSGFDIVATCPADGSIVVGGGTYVTRPDFLRFQASGPANSVSISVAPPESWGFRAFGVHPIHFGIVYAVCLKY